MCSQITDFIESLRANKRVADFDEAAVKQGIVLPLLQLLGWNPFNVNEVVPEYAVGSNRVDYALVLNGDRKAFVEVKRAREDLQDHQEQLLKYAFHQGVSLAVLTNGITSWFYLPLREGNWEDRKFFSIDVLEQDPDSVAKRFAEFLSMKRIASGEAVKSAELAYNARKRAEVIEETLPKAWARLINEQDEILVDLIAETTEALCGYKPPEQTVRRFLKRLSPEMPIQKPIVTRRKKGGEKRVDGAGYKFKKPQRFRLWGRWQDVTTWKDVLIGCCELVARKVGRRFGDVTRVRGTKRAYFSERPEELSEPRKIPGTSLYAETSYSANHVVRNCRKVLELFGYSLDDLEIDAQ